MTTDITPIGWSLAWSRLTQPVGNAVIESMAMPNARPLIQKRRLPPVSGRARPLGTTLVSSGGRFTDRMDISHEATGETVAIRRYRISSDLRNRATVVILSIEPASLEHEFKDA